jgi:hypothetical protein
LAAVSDTAGSATLQASQLFAPYGVSRYGGTSMSSYTSKGFTGQYSDATSELNYKLFQLASLFGEPRDNGHCGRRMKFHK